MIVLWNPPAPDFHPFGAPAPAKLKLSVDSSPVLPAITLKTGANEVSAEFWDRWVAENGEHPALKAGFLTAAA